jgi:hypothetical protein
VSITKPKNVKTVPAYVLLCFLQFVRKVVYVSSVGRSVQNRARYHRATHRQAFINVKFSIKKIPNKSKSAGLINNSLNADLMSILPRRAPLSRSYNISNG